MKAIREAIEKGAKTVYCNNGLAIVLPDRYGNTYDAISPPKIIQGKPVFRWIFIRLHGQNRANSDISAVEHRSLFTDDGYCYFHENEYIAKEREVNELISDNGGIDEYYTSYWLTN